MASILFGLLSALSWGGGDFLGGLSGRRMGAALAVLYAELAGLILLLAALPLVGESRPPSGNLLVAAGVGGVGCLSLLMLYAAMARGQMSIAAPVSALLAAALPILVGAFTEGLPGPTKLAGFAFALAAVWLISQESGSARPHLERLADLRLPLLAGIGFGLYFVLINRVSQTATLWPMVASRSGGTLVMLIYVLLRRSPLRIQSTALPLVSLAGVLDVGGNFFYILAGQAGRMDVAAVLASLYPGGTVFLAWLVLKERLSRAQVLGILAALVAIVLMTV
jgi:drug/metabolite transporter (DMT)-like permease